MRVGNIRVMNVRVMFVRTECKMIVRCVLISLYDGLSICWSVGSQLVRTDMMEIEKKDKNEIEI